MRSSEFRYWIDVDEYEILWAENDMLIPLNMFYGPNGLAMSYDVAHLIVIF